MMLFGKMIKKLREDQGLLQRQIASELDIDTPMYSKFERGERLPKETQIGPIARLLNTDEKELQTLCLADKIIKTLQKDKEVNYSAIKIVQKQFRNMNFDEFK